ncbi:AAA family ATPase [Acinetobacter rathckeae]|uniref:AAA family ATPase n=1 Tax=Acinetobacter rathckeae TaxID=2605272 RepID=UPI0018A2CED3|nr:AAA family ATPase [Acinetobacter rathckeae]MBF7688601.1 AAA family ATPase [Acinetobacter rathckeae]
MKILSLRLSNLASLAGEQYIDFESDPLANAGLIAITGKTGAGKSTLLDAMCLALFDQIPRLQGASGQLTDANGEVIQLKNSKHILRRGCVRGFAEVEFLALDQKRYKSRWELSRTRKKVDGKFKLDRSVTCIDDGRVMTQKLNDCTPCVQQLIGLSFEQFTRAILLAQSEVGAFLKAKDQERADLLEYLTNSNIFSLVSQCAFEKTRTFKQELEKFQDYIGHIELLSPEEISRLNNNQIELQKNIQQQQQQIKQLEHATQWYTQLHQLNAQKSTYTQQQTMLEAQQTRIDDKKQSLLDLEQFANVRHHIEGIQTAQAKQKELQQQRQQQAEKFQQAEQLFQHAKLQHEDIEKHHVQQEQKLTALQPILEQGFALDANREQLLTNYQNKQSQQHQLEQKLQQEQQQFKEQQQQIARLTQQYEQTEQTQQQLKDFLALAEEPRANLDKLKHMQQLWHTLHEAECTDFHAFEQHTQSLLQNINQLTEQYGSIDSLTEQMQLKQQQQHQVKQHQQQLEYTLKQIDAQMTQEQELQHTSIVLQQQERLLAQQSQVLEQHESEFKHAEQTLKNTQQLLAEQQLLHADHIKQLRSQLKPDEACMVCGSTAHPFITHQQLLEDALTVLHTQQEQSYITAKDKALKQWQDSQIQHTKTQSEIHHLYTQKTHYQNTIEQLKQQIQQDLAPLKLSAPTLTTEQLQHHCQQSQAQLCLEQKNLEQSSKHLQQQQQQLKTQQQQLAQQQQVAVTIQQFKQLQTEIFTLLNPSQQQIWVKSPEQAIQQACHAIQVLSESKQQLQQLKQQLDQHQQQVQLQQQQCDSLQQQLTATALETKQIKQHGLEIAEKLKQLISQHSSEPFKTTTLWHQHLQTQLNQSKQQLQQQLQQLTQFTTHYQTLKNDLDAVQQHIHMWQQQEQTHLTAQTTWQQQHPHFDIARITACLNHSAQDIQQLRQDIQQFEQQKTTVETQIKHIDLQREQHLSEQPEYLEEDIKHHIEQQLSTLTSLQEQRDTINSRLLANTQAQQQQQQYRVQIEHLQQQVNRWGKISELIGSKEGKKFQKVAQEHHLDILVEYANQQLAPLSQRYELQRIHNSLGLAIIDHDMNSEVRPVLSLSGGETFLVSLALALAIANMASGTMKLESLFIDEGFGTLDPTSLHIVMDALDRLQSQGRKVVLISHVQEMHERIPVQIQVKSIGAGTSQIHVVG